MSHAIERRARLAKAAAMGLLIGVATVACEEPAKSAADARDGGGGGANEPLDRSGAADKAHCGGKGE
jgi:hypothetical protein